MLRVSMIFSFIIYIFNYLKARDRVVASKYQFSDMITQRLVAIWLQNIRHIF